MVGLAGPGSVPTRPRARKRRRGYRAGARECCELIGKREDGQRPAQLGVIPELLVATHRAQAVLILFEPGSHADARPAADPGEDAHVLLALVLIGKDVADDSRRRLELEQLLVDVVGVDAF